MSWPWLLYVCFLIDMALFCISIFYQVIETIKMAIINVEFAYDVVRRRCR